MPLRTLQPAPHSSALVALLASFAMAFLHVPDVRADADGAWQMLFRPAARIGLTGACDPVADRVWFFGGDGEDDAYHDDLWSVSLGGGSSWVETLPIGGTPGSRDGQSMVFDPVRRRLIVFGGFVAPGPDCCTPPYVYANDLWSIPVDGPPAWSRLTPGGGTPAPRSGAAAIYDPVRDRMIVFGGSDGYGNGQADTWALSLSGAPTWTQLASCPAGQAHPAAIYDPIRDRLVVLSDRHYQGNNDVWALTLGSGVWTLLPPGSQPVMPGRDLSGVLYDPDSDRMVVFGGYDNLRYTDLSDVWAYALGSPSGWTPLTPGGPSPGPRESLPCLYDPTQRRMLVTGGDGASHDLWALPLAPVATWSIVEPDDFEPPYHFGQVGGYDGAEHRLVVFGGVKWPTGADSALWTLSLDAAPHWTRLQPANTPGNRYPIVGMFDPTHRRLLFQNDAAEVWSLSLEPPLAWTRINPVSPLPHGWSRNPGIYDPVRDRIVIFGGSDTYCPGGYNCTTTWVRETWALNLTGTPSWTNLSPSGVPPPALYDSRAIYDPVRDRMIVFGGTIPFNVTNGQTWALTLSGTPAWSMIADATDPAIRREQHSAIYDPVRDRMVVYAGGSIADGTTRLDTWALSLSGTPAWRRLLTRGDPRARRSDHLAVFDPLYDRMIVWSGYDTRTTWALTWGDQPTDVTVVAEAPVVTAASVTARWRVPGAGVVEVWRSDGGTAWRDVARRLPDGVGEVNYEDRDIVPGRRYGYRIEVSGRMAGEEWADVPGAPSLTLRAESPARDAVHVFFTLPNAHPARLELLDVAGRRVDVRDVSGAGPQAMVLGSHLSPGVYVIRLTCDRQARAVRLPCLP
jgi:hypothetical protein